MKTTIHIIILMLSSYCGKAQTDSTIVRPPLLRNEDARVSQQLQEAIARLTPTEGANEIKEYKAKVISTNFTVPLIRFNRINKNEIGAPTDRKGNVAFFNSIGAGIGYYGGRLTEVTDKDGKVISTEMHNTLGVQTGFLFASNSSTGSNSNIFALTLSISILNFQLGYGYEFGTLNRYEKRGFLTLAYGIPVSTLIRGGFFITHRDELSLDDQRKGRGFPKSL